MIVLADDGTLDTVLRCTECGEEFRYLPGDEPELEALGCDEFVDWAIEDATDEHECMTAERLQDEEE